MNADSLRELRTGLRPGKALSEVEWATLDGILASLIEGYDVRRRFKIKPKPGTPPSSRGLQQWLVLHFLALCADDPARTEKEHRGSVALAWGTTDNQVSKLVRQHRAAVQPALAGAGIAAILETVRVLQPLYKRGTRNPR